MTATPIRLRPHLLRKIHLQALVTAMDGVQERLGHREVLRGAGRFFKREFRSGAELSSYLRDRDAHTQFHPWLLWDARLEGGKMGARLLRGLLRRGGPDREVCQALLDAAPTVYQVVGNGELSTVLERVTDGQCIAIEEPVLQAVSTPGELLVARILDLGDCHLLDAVHTCLPPGARRAMVRAARSCEKRPVDEHLPRLLAAASRAMDRLCRDLTPLTDPDGQPMMRATLLFETDDAEALLQALVEAAGRGELYVRGPRRYVIAQQGIGHPGVSLRLTGSRLYVATSTIDRIDALVEDVLAALPGLRYCMALYRDLDALLDTEDLEEDRHGELARLAQDWVDEYLSRFQDTPQRTLGDLTPREAVRTPRGRDKVLAMLQTVERFSQTVGADCRSQMDSLLHELGRRAGDR